MALALAGLPLVFLVLAMTVTWRRLRLPMPAEIALPAAAALAYIIHLVQPALRAAEPPAESPGLLLPLHARVVEGFLSSLTPLAIVFGAVLLFTTLTTSGAMRVLTARLQRLAPDPLAQVLLVGWAFSYLIEGLSGFGAPAALAAPILVGLGFPPIRVAAACLIMNSVPVVFGAVGTPIWFGLGELDLSADELGVLARRAAVVQIVLAPIIVTLALALLFPLRQVLARVPAILGVALPTVAGSFAVSAFSVEFPSIVGGVVGVAAAIAVARFASPRAAAASPGDPPPNAEPVAPALSTTRALLPIALTVVLLALTRLEPLGMKPLLTATTPAAELSLGPVGTLAASPSGVVSLGGILRTEIGWSMPVLYVPFIIPFVVVALLCIPLLGMPARAARAAWGSTTSRLVRPAIALAGALVLVKLLMHSTPMAPAPVLVIGEAAASAVAAIDPGIWPAAAPVLGALGSFFSGSATVSNLTFAPVQQAVANELALDVPTVLAMQAVGGALGNMVCVHNIVAVAAVLGLLGTARREDDAEDKPARKAKDGSDPPSAAPSHTPPVAAILRLTAPPLLIALLVAALAAVLAF